MGQNIQYVQKGTKNKTLVFLLFAQRSSGSMPNCPTEIQKWAESTKIAKTHGKLKPENLKQMSENKM